MRISIYDPLRGTESSPFWEGEGGNLKGPWADEVYGCIAHHPLQEHLPEILERFERYREGLSVIYHSRVIVSVSLQEKVQEGLHAAHQGMQSRAREMVFWPNISKDLEEIRARCWECKLKQPSQAALPPKPRSCGTCSPPSGSRRTWPMMMGPSSEHMLWKNSCTGCRAQVQCRR